MFKDIGQVTKGLSEQQYISTDEISTVMFLAEKLEKPILTEGPAGVGKTELAKAWAKASGRPLIRLQCYEGLDESKALYEWEYAKQMLYTQLLRDKLSELLAKAETLTEAADRLGHEENVFFSERFLLARPLLQAITCNEPAVLLIDEIDRADAEFEAFLLEILSDFQVSVPELGTIKAKHMPTVVLTSNNTRELSEALKRRCLYLFIDYPSHESELNIVKMRVPELSNKLAQQAVEVVQSLRQMDLKKVPVCLKRLIGRRRWSCSTPINWINTRWKPRSQSCSNMRAMYKKLGVPSPIAGNTPLTDVPPAIWATRAVAVAGRING